MLAASTMQHDHTAIDYLILGLGKTGYSCARFLSARAVGIIIADTRRRPPYLEQLRQNYPDIDVILGTFDVALFDRARHIVLSPGLSLDRTLYESAHDLDNKLTGDIQLFIDHCSAPVVAVTGANGKSTVVSLFANMLAAAGKSAAVGGNIGTPALDLLQGELPDYYVLELSSFQLEIIDDLHARAAVVLNISADHLDRHAGLADYVRIKQKIYAGSQAMIINMDDDHCRAMAAADARPIRYSLSADKGADCYIQNIDGRDYFMQRQRKLLATDQIALQGKHNQANVLACLALGQALGLDAELMLGAAAGFTGLAHRCQVIAEIDQVRWVNDSKATNPGAAIAAITGLGQAPANIILLAGGDGKGADFSPLRRPVAEFVKYSILLGKDAGQLASIHADSNAYCFATDLAAAVCVAAKIAVPGDVVLLSPACSSLDMFASFEARGDSFRTAVAALPDKPARGRT